jgi:AcrR family transcriptional regulator
MPLATSTLQKASRRTQAERRDESERVLIQATLAVVAEQGVSAATFETIGQRAGYSRGLATQKFGSKSGLIERVIAYLHARRDEALEAAHVGDMNGLEALLYYADSHLSALNGGDDGKAYFMLLASTVADLSPLREAFAASHDKVRIWLESQIRRGQAEGVIRADIDPPAGAVMAGSLMAGISLQMLVDPAADLEPIRQASLAALRLAFCV